MEVFTIWWKMKIVWYERLWNKPRDKKISKARASEKTASPLSSNQSLQNRIWRLGFESFFNSFIQFLFRISYFIFPVTLKDLQSFCIDILQGLLIYDVIYSRKYFINIWLLSKGLLYLQLVRHQVVINRSIMIITIYTNLCTFKHCSYFVHCYHRVNIT